MDIDSEWTEWKYILNGLKYAEEWIKMEWKEWNHGVAEQEQHRNGSINIPKQKE